MEPDVVLRSIHVPTNFGWVESKQNHSFQTSMERNQREKLDKLELKLHFQICRVPSAFPKNLHRLQVHKLQ